MSLDFTLEKYEVLCRAILELNTEIMTLAQFLKIGQPERPILVFRHDVDRSVQSAVRMAEMEARYQIRSTYYFRANRAVFRPEILAAIHQMGHEVGYHYEVLSKARGDRQKAITLFEQELHQFQQIVPVETISMHGSPLLPWDNRDLWQYHDFHDYDVLGEAYLSIDYSRMYYFTDTGRSWDAGRYNIRDRVVSRKPDTCVSKTDDLIAFLVNNAPGYPVFINTHPNRWPINRWGWGVSFISDWLINQTKLVMSRQRGVSNQPNE